MKLYEVKKKDNISFWYPNRSLTSPKEFLVGMGVSNLQKVMDKESREMQLLNKTRVGVESLDLGAILPLLVK